MSGRIEINLGGEGEIPGVINQQGPWALSPNWQQFPVCGEKCITIGFTLAYLA